LGGSPEHEQFSMPDTARWNPCKEKSIYRNGVEKMRAGFNLFKKRSVFLSWLVSYLIILIVPVLFSITVYNESEKIIHNEINRANAAILKQVQQSIDSRMSSIESMAMDLALNNRIKAVLYPKSIDTFYRYQLIEIISKELRYNNIANDFIDTSYIYLKNSNIRYG
jgi:hypothetical protein